ncbi:MAG: hypothetical protein M1818_001937 [Claussenomyces sp. TS43310]|nr:MAG: hypothetical protein M1818_001937 [Claussenomyces sp. TS43310]
MSFPMASKDLLICTACGTQFDETDSSELTSCRVCDDPRQFVPPSGQSFTTLASLQSDYKNKHEPFPMDDRFTSIWTEPKFGIGQRCILIKTSAGNVLWDCITFLDEETVRWIEDQGGLQAIVISHPHYYTTHLEWAETFKCPVYLSAEDSKWLCREDKTSSRKLIEAGKTELEIPDKEGNSTGVKAIKLGGHFPGSLVTLYDGRLNVADTLVTTPAGLGDWKDKPRPEGMNSFAFFWSIPNMIPLPPDEIAGMWTVLRDYEFGSTHGAFLGTDIVAEDVKERVFASMKIQVQGEGCSEDFWEKTYV